MCWFKKKQKVVITNNKFHIGDMVNFKYRGEVSPGVIYEIHLDENNNVIYDINLGGECPAIITKVKEKDIYLRR